MSMNCQQVGQVDRVNIIRSKTLLPYTISFIFQQSAGRNFSFEFLVFQIQIALRRFISLDYQNIRAFRFEIIKEDKICIDPILGNMVTIMSPEGKPIQVNASALQAASAQNSMGMLRLVTFNEIMKRRELSIG